MNAPRPSRFARAMRLAGIAVFVTIAVALAVEMVPVIRYDRAMARAADPSPFAQRLDDRPRNTGGLRLVDTHLSCPSKGTWR